LAAGPSAYDQTLAMAHFAVETIQQALQADKLKISSQEERWLKRLARGVDELPADPEALRSRLDAQYQELYLPEAYGL
jgi:hypothetical protein